MNNPGRPPRGAAGANHKIFPKNISFGRYAKDSQRKNIRGRKDQTPARAPAPSPRPTTACKLAANGQRSARKINAFPLRTDRPLAAGAIAGAHLPNKSWRYSKALDKLSQPLEFFFGAPNDSASPPVAFTQKSSFGFFLFGKVRKRLCRLRLKIARSQSNIYRQKVVLKQRSCWEFCFVIHMLSERGGGGGSRISLGPLYKATRDMFMRKVVTARGLSVTCRLDTSLLLSGERDGGRACGGGRAHMQGSVLNVLPSYLFKMLANALSVVAVSSQYGFI
ncbi:hypothetical protein EVAR_66430_1 [Eumeta japonica]|uniref:Uncharacterized protein n=1 Tax=Eumeta variegata TaxID=151549 RepID=A0A4C1ZEY8_EUMVA|nr:hypothetical protein EVAR_66430_1 [Eumeta japonica]